MNSRENPPPNPGSREALAIGCTCPVLDNNHGRGYYGDPERFVMTEGCPLHWPGIYLDGGRTFKPLEMGHQGDTGNS